jgi:ApaG protein
MYPGADFQYESCCPLQSSTGHMEGSFRMKRLDNSSFDAIVPRFEFVVPTVIQERKEEPK